MKKNRGRHAATGTEPSYNPKIQLENIRQALNNGYFFPWWLSVLKQENEVLKNLSGIIEYQNVPFDAQSISTNRRPISGQMESDPLFLKKKKKKKSTPNRLIQPFENVSLSAF